MMRCVRRMLKNPGLVEHEMTTGYSFLHRPLKLEVGEASFEPAPDTITERSLYRWRFQQWRDAFTLRRRAIEFETTHVAK